MSRVTGWARWGREEDTRCVWRSLDAAFVDACITQGCRRKTSAERSTFNPPTTNPMRLLVQIWKHEEAWSLRRKRKQINKWCFVSTPMMQKVCSAFVKHVKNKHPCAYRFAGIAPTVLWISAKLKCHSSIRAHTQQKKRHTNIYQKKHLLFPQSWRVVGAAAVISLQSPPLFLNRGRATRQASGQPRVRLSSRTGHRGRGRATADVLMHTSGVVVRQRRRLAGLRALVVVVVLRRVLGCRVPVLP